MRSDVSSSGTITVDPLAGMNYTFNAHMCTAMDREIAGESAEQAVWTFSSILSRSLYKWDKNRLHWVSVLDPCKDGLPLLQTFINHR